MCLKAKPPIFVPAEYRTEIEKLSKAALMDLAWDLAVTVAVGASDADVMKTFRERAGIILFHREQ